MKLHSLHLSIKNYFRILFLLSVFGKFLYPNTFYSYILSFGKFWGINKFLYNQGIDLFYFATFVYFLVQTIEVLLIYFSFKSEKWFKFGTEFTLIFFFIVSALGFLFNILGNCGCFGDIIILKNSTYKLMFLIFCIVINSIYLFLTKNKLKKII